MPRSHPQERRTDFREIELGYPEEAARREAARCLECGCAVEYDCTLRQLATEYGIPSFSVREKRPRYPLDTSHPFIERDPNKCIACLRCVQVCSDVQEIGAISVVYRVGTAEGYGGSLLNTPCVSCGMCVDVCPVGALVAKNELRPVHTVKTICPYCGVGCGVILGVRGNHIVSVRGDPDSPVNRGQLCVKGRFGYEFVRHPDRLTTPLVRRDGKLVPVSWEEALDLVARRLAAYRGDQFAMITSARCTNEDNYVMQKFARAVMGTNNVDHCARL